MMMELKANKFAGTVHIAYSPLDQIIAQFTTSYEVIFSLNCTWQLLVFNLME